MGGLDRRRRLMLFFFLVYVFVFAVLPPRGLVVWGYL